MQWVYYFCRDCYVREAKLGWVSIQYKQWQNCYCLSFTSVKGFHCCALWSFSTSGKFLYIISLPLSLWINLQWDRDSFLKNAFFFLNENSVSVCEWLAFRFSRNWPHFSNLWGLKLYLIQVVVEICLLLNLVTNSYHVINKAIQMTRNLLDRFYPWYPLHVQVVYYSILLSSLSILSFFFFLRFKPFLLYTFRVEMLCWKNTWFVCFAIYFFSEESSTIHWSYH